jgi:hypothetical protein
MAEGMFLRPFFQLALRGVRGDSPPYSRDRQQLSKFLSSYRVIEKVTREKLVVKLRVSLKTLENWEKGHKRPIGKFWQKIQALIADEVSQTGVAANQSLGTHRQRKRIRRLFGWLTILRNIRIHVPHFFNAILPTPAQHRRNRRHERHNKNVLARPGEPASGNPSNPKRRNAITLKPK